MYKDGVKNGPLKHHGKHARWMNQPVYRWVSGCQAVKQMISLSWGAPAGLGMGSHLPQHQVPDQLYSACRSAYWCTSLPRWGARSAGLPSQRIPLLCMVLWRLWVGCWWPMLDCSPLIAPPQGSCNFHKTLVEGMRACSQTTVASFPGVE